nr:precorrin-3B synthase [Micromonospora sp. DSM 115978]
QLARVRVPGGRLAARQAVALAAAASDYGDGHLELTSRANLQVRGIEPGHVAAFAARLTDAGLLPSPTHEKIRNIVASPLSGRGPAGLCDVAPIVVASARAALLAGAPVL